MFNKNKFAQIIKNISDTYDNQREFAEKSGINRTYLSQYMNMKLDEPPKPKTLQKLADASNDVTTYEQLMKVCGYISDGFDKYIYDSEQFAESKAYLEIAPLLTPFRLTKIEIDTILNVLKLTNLKNKSIEEIKEDVNKVLLSYPEDIKNDIFTIIKQYWDKILDFQSQSLNHINPEKDDFADFKFAYHKETEGLSDEDIKEALRIYKQIKYGNNEEKK